MTPPKDNISPKPHPDANGTLSAIGEIPRSHLSNVVTPPLPESERRASLEIVSGTLTNGDTKFIPTDGTQFYVIAATAAIEIRAGNGSWGSYPARTGRRFSAGYFKGIELRNSSGADNTYTIAVGNDTFLDFRIA